MKEDIPQIQVAGRKRKAEATPYIEPPSKRRRLSN